MPSRTARCLAYFSVFLMGAGDRGNVDAFAGVASAGASLAMQAIMTRTARGAPRTAKALP